MAATATGITNVTEANPTGTTTFSSVSLGTESADRYIVFGLAVRANTAVVSSEVTIGGVSASALARQIATGGIFFAELWIAAVPSGTTGDIVVTNSSTTLRWMAGRVWSMTGANPTAVDTAIRAATAGGPVSLDVVTDGVYFGVESRADIDAPTFTLFTNQSTGNIEADGYSFGDDVSSSNTTLSVDINGGDTFDVAVFASFGPAAVGGTTPNKRFMRAFNRAFNRGAA